MVPVADEKAWKSELEAWFAPFAEALGNKKRRFWAPVYLMGLLGPGERKSIEPIAGRLAPGEQDQINHFVNQSPWETEPLRRVLVSKANALVGGPDAYLIVDDTALVKQGRMSVGVAHQYCGELGKKANCQALVSLTLARGEVPVAVGLRLFVPEAWADDAERRAACGVPDEVVHQEKWRIALAELDRAREAGARFGAVLADVGYGLCGGFRQGLVERELRYAVGIQPAQKVYPAGVTVAIAEGGGKGKGRPRKRARPSAEAVPAQAFVAALPDSAWRTIAWRRGTKGPLSARFCAVRVRMAEGEEGADGKRLPAELEQWLVGEERAGGERRYYLENAPAEASLADLARPIKGRWPCEQAHEQMKNELGLDHYEGRSWLGLCHHALLCMIAFCFLQHRRLGGKKEASLEKTGGPSSRTEPSGGATRDRPSSVRPPRRLSRVWMRVL